MLNRYDRLESALNSRGVSFHSLWKSGIISKYSYDNRIPLGKSLPYSVLLDIANAIDEPVEYIMSLIDDITAD